MAVRSHRPVRQLVALAVGSSLGLVASPVWAQSSEDPGAKQFLASCGVCHTVESTAPPRQGPNLAGIFGKPAGKRDGFKYSDALAASGLVWDEATLDRWIEDAQAALPGTSMAYRQRDPEKRKLIIAFLKSLSP